MIVLLAALLPLAQEFEAAQPTPYDRVIELQITGDEAELIEGRGPTAVVEYEVEFDGMLHVWARSDLDLCLQVDDTAAFRSLGSDDDSGGGTTPYLRIGVRAGDRLAVLVAGRSGETGAATLHQAATIETAAATSVCQRIYDVCGEAERLASEGDRTSGIKLLHVYADELASAEGASTSRFVATARGNVGRSLYRLGDGAAARELFAYTATLERILPEGHDDLIDARLKSGIALDRVGRFAEARTQRELVLAARERALPTDHLDVLAARALVATSMHRMGEFAEARDLRAAVLAAYERALPSDHPRRVRAMNNLAASLHLLGELVEARALREEVLRAYERTLPADHSDLLKAQANLAASMKVLGELEDAHALFEAAVAGYERASPPYDPARLQAQESLAVTRLALGDLAGARALGEAVLEVFEQTLPADHPDLLRARANVASAMAKMGDLVGARALRESVVAGYERTLPEDHPLLLRSRGNLASSMSAMGDLVGARALQGAVLAGYERTLPADHPDLLAIRSNMAGSMARVGDFDGARALHEAVLAVREGSLPADHPELLTTRAALAETMHEMGELNAARSLREAVLAEREQVLPANHPDVIRSRASLATSLAGTGELAQALELQRDVLARCETILPASHPMLLTARVNLASFLRAAGEHAAARAQVPALAFGIRSRALASLALAPRQASEAVAYEYPKLAAVLFLSEGDFKEEAFELTETLRLVVGDAARSLARYESDDELAPLLRKAADLRSALNDLVAGGRGAGLDEQELTAEAMRLTLARDTLEREASRRLAERGVATAPVEVARLAEALDDGEAIVGFQRVARWSDFEESMVAHVLTADGRLTRVDLGSPDELEGLARNWRRALGTPLQARASESIVAAEGQRGVRVDVSEPASDVESGHRLRARVMDPVLAACGDVVDRLYVCADDLVFLLPLDALPLEDKGRVGDRVRVVNDVSVARLMAATVSDASDSSLLALGGVAYGAEGETLAGRTRSAMLGSFTAIPESGNEAAAIAELYERAVDEDARLLTGENTTKAALFEAATGTRYVHIATHGWFAPEVVKSTADERGIDTRSSLDPSLTGLAPMTLCGLALAGANRGRDALGRVPGILTAEELCSLDLSQCELAVLSACETNVGIRRAGQGIQSLQAALYAAGARTSITSLWKVDDAATRRLFEVFYTNLWVEKMGKAEALWQAKCTLREEGHAVRDWAGWVLTGDPD